MTAIGNPHQQPPGIDRRRVVLTFVPMPIFFAVFMFLPAGTWAWTRGWLFIVVFLGVVTLAAIYLWRVNPEVIAARTRSHEGTKRWDRILLIFFFAAIYADRGQTVIDAGPYAIVRHPGYVAGVLFCVGAALCLGSVWALIPAGLASLLLILRTHWEDRTLQAELTGYREYTERVRYRLIPGLWEQYGPFAFEEYPHITPF